MPVKRQVLAGFFMSFLKPRKISNITLQKLYFDRKIPVLIVLIQDSLGGYMALSPWGPLIMDVAGLSLTGEDRLVLEHPFIGGVILFSRNYQSPEQVTELIREIRAIRADLLIAVDQEGGRVQRFKSALTRLPPMATLGRLYDHNPQVALSYATELAWLMASEMLALGVDISFAPVLDLAYGVSSVIGDRAFHDSPSTVAKLAGAYIKGMKQAGMAATGKHFPGHGAVAADSHLELPVDSRELDDIRKKDLQPFVLLADQLAAIMPAHIVYERVDANPAGFSDVWLQSVLRQELGFKGLIFSDDLSMKGATIAGDYSARAGQALRAGCDMILLCNDRDGVKALLGDSALVEWRVEPARVMSLKAKPEVDDLRVLQSLPRYQQTQQLINQYTSIV